MCKINRKPTVLALYRWPVLFRLLTVLLLALGRPTAADEFAKQRAQMIKEIEVDVHLTSRYLGKPVLDERILRVIGTVPRHEFVLPNYLSNAYENRPLPIGFGQTISQPYIVAIMTDLLALKPDMVVFELGTGSGYQAAVLAGLVKQVYTMEVIAPLGERAKQTLQRLGYRNVEVRIGDGYYGWEEQAPFDAIIVTAAGDHIPPPLVRQLKAGGRIIIPVGGSFLTQQLILVEKSADGTTRTREILPVSFVPITGKH